jgi:hypothetical protein
MNSSDSFILNRRLKDSHDSIDYQELVKGLNWREFPLPYQKHQAGTAPTPGDAANYEVTTMQRKELNINYVAFLEDLLRP